MQIHADAVEATERVRAGWLLLIYSFPREEPDRRPQRIKNGEGFENYQAHWNWDTRLMVANAKEMTSALVATWTKPEHYSGSKG